MHLSLTVIRLFCLSSVVTAWTTTPTTPLSSSLTHYPFRPSLSLTRTSTSTTARYSTAERPTKETELLVNDAAQPAPPPAAAVTTTHQKPPSRQHQAWIQAKGTTAPWECHKFGGASLATPELYQRVGDLVRSEASRQQQDSKDKSDNGGDSQPIPTVAVVSAMGGMTDLLVRVVDSALHDWVQAQAALEQAVDQQIKILQALVPDRPELTEPILENFKKDGQDILSVVQSLRMLRTVPAVTMEVVTGYGEIWSAQTLYAYLKSTAGPDAQNHVAWMDARDVLVVESTTVGLGEKGAASTGGVTVLWDQTQERLRQWWKDQAMSQVDCSQTPPIVVVTGFVAKTAGGVPTTLKRSGSDYSATIFAKCTAAARVTMWKNTDGVYTADPRRVPEAFSIASLKYDEAMELAYFGAQVLHPSAMEPCIDQNIPVYVRNIFNPSFKGTVIQGRSPTLQASFGNTLDSTSKVQNWRSKKGVIPIKGITSVDKTALVTLEGASLMGDGTRVAERFLAALRARSIGVLIITQASSESSITVAVPENQGVAALRALEEDFELELSRSTVNSLSLTKGMAIVAIVGEGMALTSGVSSTFMGSLSRANVNIHLIAQGSSERQIAVVVKASDASRALRAAHMAFTLSETTASVALLGSTGKIGSTFRTQLSQQKEALAKDLGVAVKLNLAASSKKMVQNSCGIKEDQVKDLLQNDDNDDNENVSDFDLDEVTKFMSQDVNPLRVVVDCTNKEHVAEYYEKWLNDGIHIISPGRKIGSGCLDRYHRLAEAQKRNAVKWYVESSVGSALPILTTLRDLKETGDKIRYVEGCLSGTMASIFSTFSEELPFSEAVKLAVEKGYTENDLCEDLSGIDMARKVTVLSRQMGFDTLLEDVKLESMLPEEMCCYIGHGGSNEVLQDLKRVDDSMMERFLDAKNNDCRLRYKFRIDAVTGDCKIGLEAVPNDDPVYRLRLNENLVAFATDRYETSPLIIKGAAAGSDLAAAGIFADLLRLTRAFSQNQT